MQNEGLFPDEVTFICILKACASTGDLDKGKQIHRDIVNRNLLGKDIVLGTALVDMYAKCGLLAKAQEVLRELPVRDVIPWNALITGYAQQGQISRALKCFHSMQDEGISPNVVTFICILKACGSTGAIEDGERIHAEILGMGLLGKEIMLGNALVDMYAKCGFPGKAQKVLEELHVRDVVSWNALIAGHAQLGQCAEALSCFERMQNDDDLCPDVVTFLCILKACGNAGALDKGKTIHEEIVDRGLLGKHIELGNALVDMYAKCGAIASAQEVLEELPIRDVVTWNALIAGCAEKGLGYEALSCFRKIKSESLIVPDEITLLCVLSACCHSGLSEEAEVVFGEMTQEYGIAPTLEHHTCMVVAYGYAGRFEKAMEVISVMPSSDYPTVWIALLSACRKWENAGLGRLAFDQAVQLDASCAVAYILMANIFASNGMKEDAERIEAMRLKYAPWPDNRGKASSIGGCEDVHAFSTEFMNAKVKSHRY
jgi:pentatricopeptide repeat protein